MVWLVVPLGYLAVISVSALPMLVASFTDCKKVSVAPVLAMECVVGLMTVLLGVGSWLNWSIWTGVGYVSN